MFDFYFFEFLPLFVSTNSFSPPPSKILHRIDHILSNTFVMATSRPTFNHALRTKQHITCVFFRLRYVWHSTVHVVRSDQMATPTRSMASIIYSELHDQSSSILLHMLRLTCTQISSSISNIPGIIELSSVLIFLFKLSSSFSLTTLVLPFLPIFFW